MTARLLLPTAFLYPKIGSDLSLCFHFQAQLYKEALFPLRTINASLPKLCRALHQPSPALGSLCVLPPIIILSWLRSYR